MPPNYFKFLTSLHLHVFCCQQYLVFFSRYFIPVVLLNNYNYNKSVQKTIIYSVVFSYMFWHKSPLSGWTQDWKYIHTHTHTVYVELKSQNLCCYVSIHNIGRIAVGTVQFSSVLFSLFISIGLFFGCRHHWMWNLSRLQY